MVQTLDPVVNTTLIGEDNPYYLVCLQGKYSERCHPAYLSPKAHQKLSRPDAFDGLRIHTDEIDEVVARITPGTLTVAVIMDSMDWFEPGAATAGAQIEKINRALKLGGRVLLRSAGLTPWYVKEFEALGFQSKRVGARISGSCIDR
jgi:betaine lipid synthase